MLLVVRAVALLMALVAPLIPPRTCQAGGGHAGGEMPERGEFAIHRLAVMPFGMVRDGEEVVDATRIMRAGLEDRGFDVVPDRELEAFLVARRIRKPEFIDRVALTALRDDLRVDALFMGFAEAVRDQGDPQVTLAAQMVECRQAKVVWANEAARTGSGFVTVLGLGRVESVEALLRRAVVDFLAGAPDSVRLRQRRVERHQDLAVQLGSAYARPGGEVAVQVVAAGDDAGIGRAVLVVDGRETDLACAAGRRCGGSFRAPGQEGAYTVALELTDTADARWRQDGAALLTVHAAAPEISLSSRGTAVSPNGDGASDALLLTVRTRSVVPVKRWLAEVEDQEGRAVRSEDGLGAVPEAFVWRGVDDRNLPVPDGAYRFRLTVEDAAGNVAVTPPKPVTVDTVAPQPEVKVEEVRDGVLHLSMRVADASPVPFWEFVVHDADGKVLRRFEGRGVLRNAFEVAMAGRTDPAALVYTLKANDAAGNGLVVERAHFCVPREETFALEPPESAKPRETWVKDF